MAYQSVGRPRLWINTTEWLIKNNIISVEQWQLEFLSTLPISPHLFIDNDYI